MKNIAGIMACIALAGNMANAEIEYENLYDIFFTARVKGDNNKATDILTDLPSDFDLDTITVALGHSEENQKGEVIATHPGSLTVDAALDIGLLSMVPGCSLTYDNAYKDAYITVQAGGEDWPSYVQALTINFSPTETWEDYYECKLITSTDNYGYQLWGNFLYVPGESDLQEYLSNFHFTLGGLATGLELASTTGFVANKDDIKDGQVGILLDGFNPYGSSVMITGLTLVAKVSSLKEIPTPEPTTGTLSLLALAGLCARRRRK